MIGLVLVTHGHLAEEFLQAVEHIIGRQENCLPVSIGLNDDMQRGRADILKAVEKTDSGEGVIIATDMFGGTPSNLAISVMEEGRIEVIAGVNLPMLIKLACIRKCGDMEQSLRAAQEAGRKYINVPGMTLSSAG